MASKPSSVPAVLEALKKAFGGPSQLDEPRPLEQVLLLLLSRSSDVKKAHAAMKQLQTHYVDWNEVRVTSTYEVRKFLHGLGEHGPGDKADQIREFLSTVYNRFNKLNLDFLKPDGADPDAARKRERFQGYLQEKWPALASVLTLYGAPEGEVAAGPVLTRVLMRLGWMSGKSAGATVTRESLRRAVHADDLIAAQWGIYHVGERYCHGRAPECGACPILKFCPAGKTETKSAAKAKSAR